MPAPAVVSLTTDFGGDDPFVGIMKGVILSHDPTIRVVDLCHGVPAGAVGIGGLWLGLSWRWFPSGSVHVAVVDPGVGTDRPLLYLCGADHRFLVPDNGLAAEVCRHVPVEMIRQVDWRERLAEPASQTFHGRDVFAPIAADLARGVLAADALGPRIARCSVPSPVPLPEQRARGVIGEVLLSDHFGNLMTNIPAAAVPVGATTKIRAGDAVFGLARTYATAPRGQLVGVINSFGLLEIACANGDAAGLLGLRPGASVRVERD